MGWLIVHSVWFDIDDTVVDFAGARLRGLRAHLTDIAPGLATAVRFDEAHTVWRALERTHVDRFLRGETTMTAQRRARVRAFCTEFGLGSVVGDEAADGWFAAFNSRCEAELRPFADVGPALDLLAAMDMPVGALSNSTHAVQERKLAAVGLLDTFAALICCDDVAGAAKPDRRMFEAACTALGSEPERTAYVGDDLATDALGAVNAGLVGVWLDRTSGGRRVDVPTVGSLVEFVGWLDQAGFVTRNAAGKAAMA